MAMPENARASGNYAGILFCEKAVSSNIFTFKIPDLWPGNEMNALCLLTEYRIYRNFVAVNQ